MDKGPRRASKPLGSPQKFRPGGPPAKKKKAVGALGDPLLLAPDVLDDATRRELLQDVLRPRRASPATLAPLPSLNNDHATHPDKEPFANQLRARVRAGSQNSDDLVTAMAARLKELEAKHRAYQSELQELHAKYRQLNDRYQSERVLREEAETAVLTLYDEKELLEQQLAARGSGAATPQRSERPDDQRGANLGRTDASTSSQGDNSSSSGTRGEGTAAAAVVQNTVFDLFGGDFSTEDGEAVAPTHFTNTARPGTLLFSPQKAQAEAVQKTPVKVGSSSSRTRRHSVETVDVALLQKNARILSDYVGWKGVVRKGNQAAIKERDVVRVVIYKNGICVNRGPFRPYGWALCDAFLDDLTEGYYPYEFKEKYPDGFPILVTDCSTEKCEVDGNGVARAKASAAARNNNNKSNNEANRSGSESPTPSFPADGGRRLGGAPLSPGQPRPIHTLQDCKDGDGGYAPVSAATFLGKVPAQRVTASGQLVSVREEVAALMGVRATGAAAPSGGPSSHDDPSSTMKRAAAAEAAVRRAKAHQQQQQPQQGKQGLSNSPSRRASGNDKEPATLSGSSSMILGNIMAILVRLPNGRKVTLHMAPEDTVELLRQEFIAAAPEFAHATYELCQAYPVKCVWDDHRRTLASFGIRKTCTLMLRLE